MPTWIGFLRAVNVGARSYPMAELRSALEAVGFTDVETHIQTGNVKVTSPLRSRDKVEAELERVFAEDRGFEVVTMVRTPAEISALVAEIDELTAEHQPQYGHYVGLLKHDPDAAGIALIEQRRYDGELAVVRGRSVHVLLDVPYGTAKTSNAAVEKALGPATNRNATVIRALGAKWGS